MALFHTPFHMGRLSFEWGYVCVCVRGGDHAARGMNASCAPVNVPMQQLTDLGSKSKPSKSFSRSSTSMLYVFLTSD